MVRSVLLATALFSTASAQSIHVAVTDEPVRTVPDGFYGLQYHDRTYGDPVALTKLARLPLASVRVWAYPEQFHPAPGVWDWSVLDVQIAEVVAAGYAPVVCLFQGEGWRGSTPEAPWWTDEALHPAWADAARALAARYAEVVDLWIVYDEINYLRSDGPYYFPLGLSAALYLDAARAVREADPGAEVGGPSGFAGWENGYWAARVLSAPDGPSSLDVVSANLFLSWNADDTNEAIADRTIWYEEAPLKIRSQTRSSPDLRLVLDAFNVSALWTRDGTPTGDLWTDPRNVDAFGGVVQTAALLHAAQGGFDVALRWETLGGFGVLTWYPAFEERPPYYAWELLAGPGRLVPGSTLLRTTTTAPPLPDLPHHSGMNVAGYTVQPFAVRDETGVSVVLVNKYVGTQSLTLARPAGMAGHELFRFDATRTEAALTPLSTGDAGALDLTLPGESVTVVCYAASATASSSDTQPGPPELTLRPNPSAGPVEARVSLPAAAHVRLDVLSALGAHVATVADGAHGAGVHTLPLGTERLAAGVYWVRLCTGGPCTAQALTVAR